MTQREQIFYCEPWNLADHGIDRADEGGRVPVRRADRRVRLYTLPAHPAASQIVSRTYAGEIDLTAPGVTERAATAAPGPALSLTSWSVRTDRRRRTLAIVLSTLLLVVTLSAINGSIW